MLNTPSLDALMAIAERDPRFSIHWRTSPHEGRWKGEVFTQHDGGANPWHLSIRDAEAAALEDAAASALHYWAGVSTEFRAVAESVAIHAAGQFDPNRP
ncbi:hypothetical protein SAMN06295912_1062 [Sphingomonas laterariae]|uniref:Uncharacterized protein n=1 Tax=Edaphosphingomonas laterariae TaxID=861865 RepID=A0A239E849_9SPHN|nr:hypothetical protein [Sphingomonas laterariae]SNS40641.1 hypothetical protein SAMN06295912_1062 [Sphingomonas laterariae]